MVETCEIDVEVRFQKTTMIQMFNERKGKGRKGCSYYLVIHLQSYNSS
jgi:hypothetical protein